MVNDRRAYVGSKPELERFLRAEPSVCDDLNIARLFPGGFTAMWVDGKGKMGLKDFYIQPGVKQIVYTKQGWETMASVKPMELFDRDCVLGEDITATWRNTESAEVSDELTT